MVLVDPLHVVRAGLGLLISVEPDLEVAGQASSATEALEVIKGLRRRTGLVVLVGLNLPGERDGYWLIRTVREEFPSLPVVACAAYADAAAISRALFYGADGLVDKNAEPTRFLEALRRAGRGEVVLEGLPPNWLAPIARGIDHHGRAVDLLTDREREVLEVAAEGLTARQIGARLGLRERTVTTHLSRIYRKLGTGGRVAALSVARQSGLVHSRIPE